MESRRAKSMRIGYRQIVLEEDLPPVGFRPVRPNDEPLLLDLYKSVRMEELAQTNWAPEQVDAFLKMQLTAQQLHYGQHYPDGEHFIVLWGDKPIGRLYIAEVEREVRILDITVLPEERGKGIGTAIIRELMAETAPLGKPLSIYVESFNRSYRLFERLGFAPGEEKGYSVLMAWRPAMAMGTP